MVAFGADLNLKDNQVETKLNISTDSSELKVAFNKNTCLAHQILHSPITTHSFEVL